MGRMAYAAMLGGNFGIRADSIKDIIEIKKEVQLTVIGIIKETDERSCIYITPTMKEVDALVECGCEIIAMDATNRRRPNNMSLTKFYEQVKNIQRSFLWLIVLIMKKVWKLLSWDSI